MRWSRAHLNIGALVDVETSRHSYKQPVTAGVIFLHDLFKILYKCTYLKTNETGRGSSTGIWIEKVRQDRLGVVAVKCFQQQQVQRRHRLGNAGRIIYIQRITSNEELLVATPTTPKSLRWWESRFLTGFQTAAPHMETPGNFSLKAVKQFSQFPRESNVVARRQKKKKKPWRDLVCLRWLT